MTMPRSRARRAASMVTGNSATVAPRSAAVSMWTASSSSWLASGSARAWARDTMGCVALWGAGRAGWVRIVKKFGGEDIGIVDGQPAWQRRIA